MALVFPSERSSPRGPILKSSGMIRRSRPRAISVDELATLLLASGLRQPGTTLSPRPGTIAPGIGEGGWAESTGPGCDAGCGEGCPSPPFGDDCAWDGVWRAACPGRGGAATAPAACDDEEGAADRPWDAGAGRGRPVLWQEARSRAAIRRVVRASHLLTIPCTIPGGIRQTFVRRTLRGVTLQESPGHHTVPRAAMDEPDRILHHLENDYTEPIRDPVWKHIYVSRASAARPRAGAVPEAGPHPPARRCRPGVPRGNAHPPQSQPGRVSPGPAHDHDPRAEEQGGAGHAGRGQGLPLRGAPP